MRFDTKPYTGYIFMVAGLRSDAERVAVEDDIVFVRVIKVPMHTEPHWPKPLKPVKVGDFFGINLHDWYNMVGHHDDGVV
jgi:hypothetical protein